MITISVMAIVIAATDNPAMLAIAWDTLAVFFFHHVGETGDESVNEEEQEGEEEQAEGKEEEQKGRPRPGGALALLGQFQLSHLAADRPHHLFEVR